MPRGHEFHSTRKKEQQQIPATHRKMRKRKQSCKGGGGGVQRVRRCSFVDRRYKYAAICSYEVKALQSAEEVNVTASAIEQRAQVNGSTRDDTPTCDSMAAGSATCSSTCHSTGGVSCTARLGGMWEMGNERGGQPRSLPQDRTFESGCGRRQMKIMAQRGSHNKEKKGRE
jgi:hypothetical protein